MSAYLTKVLRPNERVLFDGRLHWVIYGQAFIWVAIGFIFMVGSFLSSGNASAIGVISLLVGVVALCSLLAAAVRRATTEIAVTDLRVIYKAGWLRRRTMEMNVSKIETVDVVQGLAARVFGFGTVVIRGTGSSFEPLNRVMDPLALRNAILVG